MIVLLIDRGSIVKLSKLPIKGLLLKCLDMVADKYQYLFGLVVYDKNSYKIIVLTKGEFVSLPFKLCEIKIKFSNT